MWNIKPKFNSKIYSTCLLSEILNFSQIQEIVDMSHHPRSDKSLPDSDVEGSPPQVIPTVTVSDHDDLKDLVDSDGIEAAAESLTKAAENGGDTLNASGEKMVHFTFTPAEGKALYRQASRQMDGSLKPGAISV